MTRVLICGDRNWTDFEAIHRHIKTLPKDSVIIQGMCRGADLMARSSALLHGLKVEDYPADWNKYGRAAGPIRNRQMLDEGKPDIVYAFHPNIAESKGTKNMVNQAKKRGIEVIIVEVKNNLKRESKEVD